jgi:hypothetical protein
MQSLLTRVIAVTTLFMTLLSHAESAGETAILESLIFPQDVLPANCMLRETPPGETLPYNIPSNPHVSSDRQFVHDFSSPVFSEDSGITTADIREALYSVYLCSEKEIGIFAWRFANDDQARAGMKVLSRGIKSSYRISSAGSILVLQWSDAADDADGLAMQRLVNQAMSGIDGPQMRTMSMEKPQN